jgi:uncharacterized protein YkwD
MRAVAKDEWPVDARLRLWSLAAAIVAVTLGAAAALLATALAGVAGPPTPSPAVTPPLTPTGVEAVADVPASDLPAAPMTDGGSFFARAVEPPERVSVADASAEYASLAARIADLDEVAAANASPVPVEAPAPVSRGPAAVAAVPAPATVATIAPPAVASPTVVAQATSTPAAVAPVAAPVVVQAPAPPEPSAVPALSIRERGLLDAMNRERATAGAPPLRIHPTLMEVARERSRDMSENDYFAHVGPNGESAFALIGELGLSFPAVGENLARVSGNEVQSVRSAIAALMASPSHRRNILKERYELVGVGTVTNASGQTVFTTVFAGG